MDVNNTVNKNNPELLRYLDKTIEIITIKLRRDGEIKVGLNIYSSLTQLLEIRSIHSIKLELLLFLDHFE
jgi:hypothetical protein